MTASMTPGNHRGIVYDTAAILCQRADLPPNATSLAASLLTQHDIELLSSVLEPRAKGGWAAIAWLTTEGGHLTIYGETSAVVGIGGRARIVAGKGFNKWSHVFVAGADGVVLGDLQASRVDCEPVDSPVVQAGSVRLGSATPSRLRKPPPPPFIDPHATLVEAPA